MLGLASLALAAAALLCGRADLPSVPGDVPRLPAVGSHVLRACPGRAAWYGPISGSGEPRPVTLGATVSRDAWFGQDKVRHLAMSFAATTFSFAALRTAGVEGGAVPAALTAAAVVGLGKEFYDRRSGSGFSRRDLVWDALGALAGYALIRNLD